MFARTNPEPRHPMIAACDRAGHWVIQRPPIEPSWAAIEIMHSTTDDRLPAYPIRGLLIGMPQIAAPLSTVDRVVARWLQRCHDYDTLGLEVAR